MHCVAFHVSNRLIKAIAEEKLAAAKPALAEAEAALQVRKIWNWTLMLSTMSIHYQSCMWHIHAILSTHHPCRLSKLLTSPQFANWGTPHTSSCASWTVPCCCSRGSWIPLPWPRPTRSQAFVGRVTQGSRRGIYTFVFIGMAFDSDDLPNVVQPLI